MKRVYHLTSQEKEYDGVPAGTMLIVFGLGTARIKGVIGEGAYVTHSGSGDLRFGDCTFPSTPRSWTLKSFGSGNCYFATSPGDSVIVNKNGTGLLVGLGEVKQEASSSSSSSASSTTTSRKRKEPPRSTPTLQQTSDPLGDQHLARAREEELQPLWAPLPTSEEWMQNMPPLSRSMFGSSIGTLFTTGHVTNVFASSSSSSSSSTSFSLDRKGDDYSAALKPFVDSQRKRDIPLSILIQTLEMEESDAYKALHEECKDSIMESLCDIPVRLNGHLYDFSTLEKLEKNIDPLMRYPFEKRDIQPAFDIVQRLEAFLAKHAK